MMKKEKPGPGQESVWDYPRPPAMEQTNKLLKVEFNDHVIAETQKGLRILETSQPPAYYFPPGDVQMDLLERAGGFSICEWKGNAHYYHIIVDGKKSEKAAWSYREPHKKYQALKDYIAFYPGRVDACFVDGEKVKPQDGNFYGGWITDDIVGPIKGGPGTFGW